MALRPAAALLLGLALSSALPTFASAEMVWRRGNTADPETLDPHKTQTVYESDILYDTTEGLVSLDAKAAIIPAAAASWTSNADATVFTFKMRPDEKWSNGDPVTAGDFVYSLRRLEDPATASGYAAILYTIKNAEAVNKGKMKPEELGVRAIDDATLEITLEHPTPFFIAQLAHQSAMPVNAKAVQAWGKDFIKPEHWVSNGAFVLKDYTPNDHLTLVKNPMFRDAANVKLDRVVFYPTEDRAAALRRFQAGELDSNNDFPVDQVAYLRANMKDELKVSPYLGTYYFSINTAKKPFDDVRIRDALSLVIDREFLAEQIWGGTMIPAYSFIPPGIANYGKPAEVTWKDLSPIEREDKAKALLKAAGYGPGLKPLQVEIHYNTSENHKKTSIALADMWKPFNIEVKLVNTDTKTHYALLRDKGDYDVARAGWIADYSDPQNFLFLAQSNNPGLDYSNYKNPEFDALMAKAADQTDLTARASTLHDAEAILMRDEPNLALLFYGSHNLVSKKVIGWESNTLDRHLARYVSIAP